MIGQSDVHAEHQKKEGLLVTKVSRNYIILVQNSIK